MVVIGGGEVWYVQEPDFRRKFSSVFEEIFWENRVRHVVEELDISIGGVVVSEK